MRVERLILTAGDNAITLDFHRHLTIVGGLGRFERDSLSSEVIGALAGHRAGVHLEVADDNDRNLAVFRPRHAPHRIVDVDAVNDVTPDFADPDGRVDLLAQYGLDMPTARRKLRFTAADLETSSQADGTIRALASAHQDALWNAAEALRTAERRLEIVAQEIGSAPEDAEVVERIEASHAEHEAAMAHRDHSRRIAFAGGALCAGFAALLSMSGSIFSLVFAAATVVLAGVAWFFQRRVDSAAEAERKALAAAGAESYLGFHLQRVNQLLSGTDHRHRLLEAATERRQAQLAWQAVAGEATVEFALAHRNEIRASARVRADVGRLDAVGSCATTEPESNAAQATAQALSTRLSEAAAGYRGETMPLILDDPFAAVPPALKPALLEMLSEGDRPQLILLTDDEDVVSWARLESLTGDLAVIEASPSQGREPSPA